MMHSLGTAAFDMNISSQQLKQLIGMIDTDKQIKGDHALLLLQRL